MKKKNRCQVNLLSWWCVVRGSGEWVWLYIFPQLALLLSRLHCSISPNFTYFPPSSPLTLFLWGGFLIYGNTHSVLSLSAMGGGDISKRASRRPQIEIKLLLAPERRAVHTGMGVALGKLGRVGRSCRGTWADLLPGAHTCLGGERQVQSRELEVGRIYKGLFQNLGIALCGQRLSTKAFQAVFCSASRSRLTDRSRWNNWLMLKPVGTLNSHDLVLLANQKWESTRSFRHGLFSWTETGLSWEGFFFNTKVDLYFIRKILKQLQFDCFGKKVVAWPSLRFCLLTRFVKLVLIGIAVC